MNAQLRLQALILVHSALFSEEDLSTRYKQLAEKQRDAPGGCVSENFGGASLLSLVWTRTELSACFAASIFVKYPKLILMRHELIFYLSILLTPLIPLVLFLRIDAFYFFGLM